ncbi:hypothetical protein ACYJ80_11925 [Staphylococcus capitis]|uniref:Uncharacterized protein n=3 Tax=Staphylococcus TaxID=1279 RepID=Q5HMU3_STAEQ|nr:MULTISPECIES: hypothetical protein [Staphylococcus]YP_009226777.1 hypothetical protein AXJ01_gp101 [Staphylococcus phage SPbeta-like]EON81135.1 hypothetical protein H700_08835 [Staphylococcus epidermidis 41tr]EON83578.1 hypothetical protein H701_04293 [Staphylococcus epidermidis 528m]EON87104.1 hypothetical protein D592_00175 [Staphylococcus epidermidis 36-1]KKD21581.1 hypothetical protein XA21_10885 [Staphylococcus cohnii subsp. cohnii]QPB07705.1 hypothetical protein PLKLOBMN_00134 [Staph
MKVLNIDKHNEILALKEEIEMIEDYGVNNMNLEELQYLKRMSKECHTYMNCVNSTINNLQLRDEHNNTEKSEELKYYEEKLELFKKYLPQYDEYKTQLEEVLAA